MSLILTLAAWGFLLLIAWNLWGVVRYSVQTSRQLHQIPCANCQFFTNSHYLKCPIHPKSALTEEAINCSDYWP